MRKLQNKPKPEAKKEEAKKEEPKKEESKKEEPMADAHPKETKASTGAKTEDVNMSEKMQL